jgi:hypothetical protein
MLRACPHFLLFLSLAPSGGRERVRKWEREKEGGRERKKERVRKRERDVEYGY